MVCGVFRDDDMVGIVSVHYTKGARAWSVAEVAMIQHACDAVRAILDAIEDV
jgi:GAF domain-containing protein